MIHRMIYTEPITKQTYEVDLYHFVDDVNTLETYGVCWIPTLKYWTTIPIWCLEPKIESHKNILNEGKS